MSTGSSQTGRLQQTGSPGAPAATALPLKSHGSADLMELEALLADREVVQCHCHHRLDGHELEQAWEVVMDREAWQAAVHGSHKESNTT